MAEIEIIGQMDNTIDHTFESANRVYGVEGIAPTILTCAGGGIQPKIMEIKEVEIKQATKEGYIPCLLGGGGRFGIPNKPNTKRQSNREWNDKSNADNSEYP